MATPTPAVRLNQGRLLAVLALLAVLLTWQPGGAQYGGGTPTVQFESSSYAYSESDPSAWVVVTLSAPVPNKEVTVKCTLDGLGSTTVTFAPGQVRRTTGIPLSDNTTADGHKSYKATLSEPVNADLGEPKVATVLILDDDLPPPTVLFASSDYYVSENDGVATITVTLDVASAKLVTVKYTVSDGPSEDSKWSSYPKAISPTDYLAIERTLEFFPGETTKTFDVDIYPDDLEKEGDETVRLKLGAQTNATLGLAAATLVILNAPQPAKPTEARIDPVTPSFKDPTKMKKEPIEITPDEKELNQIRNPAAILIEDKPTKQTAARIEVTLVMPEPAKPADLEWKIKSVKDDGEEDDKLPKRADFLDGKNGKTVYVYGLKGAEGRVRLEVWNTGDGAKMLDYYEAWVVSPKVLYFRVNLLSGSGEKQTTTTTPELAEQHITIAKILLRQTGIVLAEDPDDTTLTDEAKKVKKGYFTAKVDAKYVEGATAADLMEGTIKTNYRAKISQIMYIKSEKESGDLGYAPYKPDNNVYTDKKPAIKLTFRRKDGDESKLHEMHLAFSKLHANRPENWGAILNNELGDPLKERQKYGIAIAHELGHVLKLDHRGSDGMGTDLPHDYRNTMTDRIGPLTTSNPLDFDLIELIGVRDSKALVAPP